MAMVTLMIFVASITCCFVTAGSTDQKALFKSFARKITALPGIDPGSIKFKQFSGYLQASETRFLHFWYVESQRSPEKDPVLLWLQGGPGCSSIFGLLGEHGPFRVDDDGRTLIVNPHSWNLVANVLYLEAPCGAGYSFATDNFTDTSDDQMAKENYAALKDFFRLFPALKKQDFFVSGESYSGISVPTLAVLILNGMSHYPLNFKGAAVDNGWLSNDLISSTMPEFLYGHGMADKPTYRWLTDLCAGDGGTKAACVDAINTVLRLSSPNDDVYAMYSHCPDTADMEDPRPHYHYANMAERAGIKLRPKPRRAASKARGVKNPDPCCINEDALTEYMNLPDLRKALFIPEHLDNWTVCDWLICYSNYSDMFQQVKQMANTKGFRTLIYNGDVDMMCNFFSGQEFTRLVNQTLLEPLRSWDAGDYTGGFITRYEQLDFTTVFGAGHMAAACRPEASLKLISSFLTNQPL